MSDFRNHQRSNTRRTYYDILEVHPTATGSEIRKSYLKKSLQYHPDKNPADPEVAKAKFVEIGAAYETLSDPVQRRQYDQELRSGPRRQSPNESSSSYNYNNGTTSHNGGGNFDFSEQTYDDYRDIFDATVAGMSEEELAAAVGTVAAIAGVVGSMIGNRLVNGRARNPQASARGGGGGGSTVLSVAGSMIGSMVASEVAASSVRALHQESVQRIAYKEECRRALARGEPIPDPPRKTNFGDVVKRTIDSVKNVAQTTMGEDPSRDRTGASTRGNQQRSPMNDMWKKAAEGVWSAAMKHNTQRAYS